MTRASLALVSLLAVCGCSRAPSSTMAVLLDSLVPGTRLGALAAPVAQRYHLKFDPSFGYSDHSYWGATGVRGIVVKVNEDVSVDHRPSDSARIAGVALTFDSRHAADSLRELLTRKLGTPEPLCYTTAMPGQMTAYFWPNGKAGGLELLVSSDTSRGGALLTFGAMQPDSSPDFQCTATPM